jgi:Domain of unknown function (DU1801)
MLSKEKTMAELKTKMTAASVDDFLNSLQDEQKTRDCFEIIEIMKEVTKEDPRMWGSSIVGFGSAHLKYASGREIDWMIIGFSPRKQNLTLYLTGNFNRFPELLKNLGKYKTGAGCLYIKTLKDIDIHVLKELVGRTVESAKKMNSTPQADSSDQNARG